MVKMKRRQNGAEDYVIQDFPASEKLMDGRILYPSDGAVCRYVDLMSDTGFKLVFGTEANKDILIDFLNEVIPEHCIKDLEYMDKEKHGDSRDERGCVFDVYCRTDSGVRIIVEVQKRSHDWYVERTLYYSTFPVREQMDVGEPEYRMCPVYVISILQGVLGGINCGDGVLSRFRLYEENNHTLLTDKYNLVFIELGKFRKRLNELDGSIFDGFCYSLRNMANLMERPVELQQAVFSRLFEAARIAKMDKIKHFRYKKTMITERDIHCIALTERRIGLEKGMEQGVEDGIAKVVKAMKKHGMPMDVIAAVSGWTEEKIRGIGQSSDD